MTEDGARGLKILMRTKCRPLNRKEGTGEVEGAFGGFAAVELSQMAT